MNDEEMTTVYGLTSIFLTVFILLLILAGLGSLPVWVIFAGLLVINAILIAAIVNDIRNNKCASSRCAPSCAKHTEDRRRGSPKLTA